MPASKKIEKLGIIAGAGHLPRLLAERCLGKNIEPFIVGFSGQTDSDLLKNHKHVSAGLGQAGKIIKALKQEKVQDLVLIGSIKRPSWNEIKPDLKGIEILSRIGLKTLGDNGLLTALKKEFEREGLQVHGIQKFFPEFLTPHGAITKGTPSKEQWKDIKQGFYITQELGKLDIGQAAIIQNGLVLGVEAIEGTDKLIQRCGILHRKGTGGVLIKTCKPQQDRDLDLPTIGIETIESVQKAGLSGIAIHAGESIIIDKDDVAKRADQYNIFIVGVSKSDLI